MNTEEVLKILMRDAISIYSIDSLRDKLNTKEKLRIKLGADPSRPDLHLGHSVVLRKLRMLQDLGHEIIFVIGDFTGMIGDPSGKSKARIPLTFEETRKNGQSYFEQVTKILDKNKTTITYNSEWLSKLNFADILSLAGKYTLARIMERDDFSKRYNDEQPIGLHELFYPLMQGYDSVALCADIEVGGTDQTFNLLVGRELQKDYDQLPQEVITFPLLLGLDGIEKMSKSLDNYIGIDEPAEVMFEKCMKVPDHLLGDYFRLTTDFTDMPEDIREAHFMYARKIVEMYHNTELATIAEQRYLEIAKKKIPQTMNEITLHTLPISILNLIRKAGFASSNSEARRLINGNGIKIDGEFTNDVSTVFYEEATFVLSRGKNKFVRIILK